MKLVDNNLLFTEQARAVLGRVARLVVSQLDQQSNTNILGNIVGNRIVDFIRLTEYLKSFVRKWDLHTAVRWSLQGKLSIIVPEPHY